MCDSISASHHATGAFSFQTLMDPSIKMSSVNFQDA